MKASEHPIQECFQFGPFRVDTARRLLLNRGVRVALPSKAFDVLVVLIENRGQVIEKETLIGHVWPDTSVEENSLSKTIAAVRKALGEQPGDSEYIVTVPGRGYSFAAPVSAAFPDPPRSAPLALPVLEVAGPRRWYARVGASWLGAIAAGLLLLSCLAAAVLVSSRMPATARTVRRFPLMLPDGISRFVLSPDGEKLLYTTASEKPETRLFDFASGESRALPILPVWAALSCWSPDSRWIGVPGGRQFRRFDLSDNSARMLVEPNSVAAGSIQPWVWSPAWGGDGSFYFQTEGKGIMRIPGGGGEQQQVTRVVPPEKWHLGFQPLPQSRCFLFFAQGQGSSGEVRAGCSDGQRPAAITTSDGPAVYASGYLLYLRGDTLIAQRFDAARAVSSGPPQPLLNGVARAIYPDPAPPGGIPQFSASQTGVLIYRPGTGFRKSRLTWFDRAGKAAGVLGDPADYASPTLSPDGRSLAAQVKELNGWHIWIFDLTRGGRRRLRLNGEEEWAPAWSPDGARIAFVAKNRSELHIAGAAVYGQEETLLSGPQPSTTHAWSPDGSLLAYSTAPGPRNGEIWFVPLTVPRASPTVFRRNGVDQCSFSPDGKFIAYRSSETGRFEIFVELLTGGRRWQISTAGGQEPQWSSNGKELFYVAWPSTLTAVDIRSTGNTVTAGVPQALFDVPHLTYMRNRYAAEPGGRRFLVVVPEDEGPRPPPIVIENWPALLSRK